MIGVGDHTTDGTGAAPLGIDVDIVTDWLTARCDWMTGPFTWEKLPGGHSNLTYLVTEAGGRRFVLRRPPLGELLPSAHDMGREFKLVTALWPTAVPVPEPIAFCDDKSVTGANFYAMGQVIGMSLYTRTEAENLVPEERRHGLGMSFIEVLAELHAIDPANVGLADLGRPDAYVARQLKRWYSGWNASKAADDVRVDALHDFLQERLPEQGPGRVVHGDYGLHNCISNSEGVVAAVVDWEISTLGDPLADLAYALNTWEPVDDVDTGPMGRPTTAAGFPSRQELLTSYAERTGADVSSIDFYVAFNHWKTACILAGVAARYDAGQKSTEGIDVPRLRSRIDAAIGASTAAAGKLGYKAA